MADAMLEPMTRVQTRFRLTRALDDSSLNALAAANAIYGIQRLKLEPSMDELFVEYDASRLRPAEVEYALATAGIPIDRRL
jgi:hypothetical protein